MRWTKWDWFQHLAIPKQVLSCTTSICPTTATEVSETAKPPKRNSQSCKVGVLSMTLSLSLSLSFSLSTPRIWKLKELALWFITATRNPNQSIVINTIMKLSFQLPNDHRKDSEHERSALLGSSEERTGDEIPESPSGSSLPTPVRATSGQLVHGRLLDGSIRRYSNHSGRSQDSINSGFWNSELTAFPF